MTAPAPALDRPALQLTKQNVAALAVAALAWAAVIAYARDMGNGAGTMGMPAREFAPMWAGMMTAMMLPAVAPVASLYVRTITSDRTRRLVLFLGGYLLAWSVIAVPAYIGLRLVDDHASASAMRTVAVVLLVAAGVYQLTPLKAMCLRHCRSPLGQLLHYGNVKGRWRDLKVALHHALFCVGCCWALMALFIAFGVMNVWAMVGLAAVVLGEKLWKHGELLGRAVGVGFVVLALSVALSDGVADAVVAPMDDDPVMTEMEMSAP